MNFRREETPSGATIFVGRNARQNDALVAAHRGDPSKTWLHEGEGRGGAHVVLVSPGGRHSDADVERAARLALFHSKVTNDDQKYNGVVHYCSIDDVVKPKKAPPGLVEIRDYRSMSFFKKSSQKRQ